MFIRSRTSKGRPYLQLVRGYRDADGVVRQETVGLGIQSDPPETLSITEVIRQELAHEREWLRKSKRERGQWAKHDTAFARKQHAQWERSISRVEDKIKRLEAALVDTTDSNRVPDRVQPATGSTLTQQPLTQKPGAALPTKPDDHDGHREDVFYGAAAIARALGVAPRQVQELRARHGLPTFRIGKMLCARASELDLWIEQRRDDSEHSA